MGTTVKASVAIGAAELAWAKARARKDRTSLSAVVTESLAARQRAEALAEVLAWMGEGRDPLTEAEIAAAARQLRSRKR